MQCATQCYFKPGENPRRIAEIIDPKSAAAMTLQLSTLQRGEFIAKGLLVTESGTVYNRPIKLWAPIPETETRAEFGDTESEMVDILEMNETLPAYAPN